jgi:hypothetical protein
MPLSIVSDRDVRFTSQVWEDLHKRLDIKLRRSTRLQPQTDGQTEHCNGVLEETLRHFVGPFQNDWKKLLLVVEFAMNNAWNLSIQNMPLMLNYGQHPDTPVIVARRSRNDNVNQFIGRLDPTVYVFVDMCIDVIKMIVFTVSDHTRHVCVDRQWTTVL